MKIEEINGIEWLENQGYKVDWTEEYSVGMYHVSGEISFLISREQISMPGVKEELEYIKLLDFLTIAQVQRLLVLLAAFKIQNKKTALSTREVIQFIEDTLKRWNEEDNEHYHTRKT